MNDYLDEICFFTSFDFSFYCIVLRLIFVDKGELFLVSRNKFTLFTELLVAS